MFMDVNKLYFFQDSKCSVAKANDQGFQKPQYMDKTGAGSCVSMKDNGGPWNSVLYW